MSAGTQEHDITFKGTSGCECEAFVVAIRDLAFAKGQEEDHHWMLHFAITKLRGKALRWHAQLDPSIKRDWDLFVQALFDQYPFVEEHEETRIGTPTWSATSFSPTIPPTPLPPSPTNTSKNWIEGGRGALNLRTSDPETPSRGSQSSPTAFGSYQPGSGQQIGRLRVINEEDTTPAQYIGWGNTMEEPIEWGNASIDDTRTTTNRDEALLVSFLPSSAPHRISCLNSRANITALAVYFTPAKPDKTYNLAGISQPGMNPLQNSQGHASKIWNVLEGGVLQVSLSTFPGSKHGECEESKFTTTEVHVNTAGRSICFAKPGALLPQDRPGGDPFHPFVRGRIIFELL